MAIEPVHCDSSSILKVLFLGQPVCFLVFMFVSVCLRLRLSAPSRLDLRVRWRLQNVFVSVLLFMSVFPCIYVCVCLSQPLLVWIWESVEDCKTFLSVFICLFYYDLCFCVCVCLSQPLLVWIWESVEDCKTFLSVFICLFYYDLCFCVCVCLSQHLLVWIWESVEDCKTSTRVVSSEQGL